MIVNLGNSKSIGATINFIDENQMLGYANLWVNNKKYGTFEDLIFIKGYFVNLIEDLIKAKSDLSINLNQTNEQIFNQLIKKAQNENGYYITSSSFTDDFIGFKILIAKKVYLFWRLLHEGREMFKDLDGYPEGILRASFDLDDAISLLKEVNEEIKMREHNKKNLF